MTDHTPLAREALADAPSFSAVHWEHHRDKVTALARAVLELQAERDELAAAWKELKEQHDLLAEFDRGCVEKLDELIAVKADRDRLAAEVARLQAKLTCQKCGREIHATHYLECSHERTGE